jgi:antirestriction protein ArdC
MRKKGACGPRAVKTKPFAEAAVTAGAFPSFRPLRFLPRREIPLSPAAVLTARPPLIAAWLVRLHAQPANQGQKAMSETGKDIYQRVTDQIVAELEKGVRPWLKPWNADHAAGRITRPLRANGIPYRGINVLMLWASATEKGFAAPLWLTYKQAQELGGQVRKGEKGSLVVYANTITRTETDETTGEDLEREIPFMKGYTVFNAEQVDGLPEHFYTVPQAALDPVARIAKAETFFAATGAEIHEGGNRACYNVTTDRVQMPPFVSFADPEAFYATLAHEITHWTRHPKRLSRDFGRRRFGDEGYAMEELVAELGAAFVCADLVLTLAPREEHAAYIGSWLKVLKDDKRAIFAAAAHAQRAADYLAGLQPQAIEVAA